jgi:hypothetical protein
VLIVAARHFQHDLAQFAEWSKNGSKDQDRCRPDCSGEGKKRNDRVDQRRPHSGLAASGREYDGRLTDRLARVGDVGSEYLNSIACDGAALGEHLARRIGDDDPGEIRAMLDAIEDLRDLALVEIP